MTATLTPTPENTPPRKENPMAEKPITFTHTAAADDWAKSEDRVVIFSVSRPNPDYEEWKSLGYHEEGDSGPDTHVFVDYTMPRRPNVGLSLEYLRVARINPDLGMSWIIETAIGTEGYDALVAELTATPDAEEAKALLARISEKIQTVALGGLEAPKA